MRQDIGVVLLVLLILVVFSSGCIDIADDIKQASMKTKWCEQKELEYNNINDCCGREVCGLDNRTSAGPNDIMCFMNCEAVPWE